MAVILKPISLNLIGLLIFTIIFSGCLRYGPTFMESERSNYNLAIQKTNDEQLILNLVRLKYHDTPLFMEVNNIASQFKFKNDIDLTSQLQVGAKGIFTPNVSTFIEERPTVSYSPLHGEKFVKSVLTAVSLKTISLLFHSGWSIDRIFKVCLQRIGPLKNAPGASGPTPKVAPKVHDFFKAVESLRTLQVSGALDLIYREVNGIPELVIKIIDKYKDSRSANHFARSMKVAAGKTNYIFTESSFKKIDASYFVTRSLLGIMFYLSQGVEVPEKDIVNGKIIITKTDSGENFDWKVITGELLKIQHSDAIPDDSNLTIFYRGYWFYISDTDLTSKSTFSLLAQVYALQAGDS